MRPSDLAVFRLTTNSNLILHRSRISPVDGDSRRALANSYIRTAVTGRKLVTAISAITMKVANVAP